MKTLTQLATELDQLDRWREVLIKAGTEKPRIEIRIVAEDPIIFDDYQDSFCNLTIGLLVDIIEAKKKEVTRLMYPK